MKKALLAACILTSAAMMVPAAHAADIAPAAYDWTGIYFGVNAGAGFNNSDLSNSLSYSGANIPGGPTADQLNALLSGVGNKLNGDDTAFTGGGMIGYNWQHDALVLGAEADLNYLGFGDSATRDVSSEVSAALGQSVTAKHKLSYDADWYGTLRGRIGFAADNLLIYGTGGLAYGHMSADSKAYGYTATDSAEWNGSADSVNWGWTAGAGIEYGIDNWSLGVEYLYVDLGSTDWDSGSKHDLASGTIGPILDQIKADASFDYQFSVVRATAKLRF